MITDSVGLRDTASVITDSVVPRDTKSVRTDSKACPMNTESVMTDSKANAIQNNRLKSLRDTESVIID